MEQMDIDSDTGLYSDEEKQLEDLRQLTAALEDDEDEACISTYAASAAISQRSSMASTSVSDGIQEQAKIDSALALNKLLDEKLRRLEKVLIGRLQECRQRLGDLQSLAVPGDKTEKHETFRYVNCGKPYFKDKSNFPAPDNDDTILMAKTNMYDFSEVMSVPGWTVKDKCNLTKLLHKMSIDIKKKELTSKIAQLRREGKKVKPKQLSKEIDAINKEITALSKKPLKELALPIDQEYDWEIVANKLNRRHSAQEYRSLWKLFLHPSINKEVWSKNEHARLLEIADQHNLQDWDTIAKELNTGRTGYQCFVYFRTNMNNTLTGNKWTKEEEEYLKRLIEYYKEEDYIPWGKVAAAMENRTKIQIYNKYFRLVEKRKGRFLPEEDAVILTCYDKFGKNFKKMAEYLPGRSSSQLRVRYYVLAKERISTVWTVNEDRELLQLMANQDVSTNYSSVTKHFPGKTRANVRTRFITLMNWMKRNPNLSLEKAPRRGARRLGHGLPTDNLNKAVKRLKHRIESEVHIRKSKRITKESAREAIEDAIVVNLLNEQIKEQQSKPDECDDEEFELDDNTSVSMNTMNVTNLQKLIILLKGKLKQNLFKNSSYAEQYPELLNTKGDANIFRVKSYSKKSLNNVIQINGSPDIWGGITLGDLMYVLPPNYATITGCRKLMAYVSAKLRKDAKETLNFNLNALIKKNPLLKQQLFLLMERFNTLFLWPMLLSNEGPEHVGKNITAPKNYCKRVERKTTNTCSVTFDKNATPTCSAGFLVPPTLRIQNIDDTSSIDLQVDPKEKEKTILKRIIVDNELVRFISEEDDKKKAKQ